MNHFSIHSLPLRLSLVIFGVLLLLALTGGGLLGWLWFSDLSRALEESGTNSVQASAAALDRVFASCQQTGALAAAQLERENPGKDEVLPLLKTLFASARENTPEIAGIAIAYKENMLVPGEKTNVFLAFAGSEKTDYTASHMDYLLHDWFFVPVTLEKPVWTIPFPSELGMGGMLLSYAVPFFRTENGRRVCAGAVVVDLRMNELTKFLTGVSLGRIQGLSDAGEIFLLNQFGQVVLYPGRSEDMLQQTIFTICDDPADPDPADRKAAQRIFQTKSGRLLLNKAPLLSGPSDVFYARTVNGWAVCIAIPAHWIRARLLPLAVRFLLGWLAAIALIVAVIFLVCIRMNRPLVLLAKAASAVGRGDFNAPLPPKRGDDEIGCLTVAFANMRHALQEYLAKLEESIVQRKRAEGELSAAKAIQQDILPHILPPLEHYPNVRAAADLLPARGVGGDLYDVFPVDGEHLAVIIGDVSGKGVPAALYMAVTQTLQRTIAAHSGSPGQLLTKLNEMLASGNSTKMFVTYWAGYLNTRTGVLTFSNGGHNPPLLCRADGTVERLKLRHGPPLGVVKGRQYKSDELRMNPGDLLVLYTDGVTEAKNASGGMFGDARLLESVTGVASGTPAEGVETLKKAVADFTAGAEQSDDITLLITKFDADHPE